MREGEGEEWADEEGEGGRGRGGWGESRGGREGDVDGSYVRGGYVVWGPFFAVAPGH